MGCELGKCSWTPFAKGQPATAWEDQNRDGGKAVVGKRGRENEQQKISGVQGTQEYSRELKTSSDHLP